MLCLYEETEPTNGADILTKKELTYITTVAEYGNISKAADTLLVTQPSLSRCIQKVESDLGTELFKRTPDGLILTDAGTCYIESARLILQTYKELEIKVSHLNEMKAGSLTIGTASVIGAVILPQVLPVFTSRYPNVKIKIVEGASADIEYTVIRGSADIGLLHAPFITEKGLEHRAFSAERFMLAVPCDDKLNSLAYVDPDTGKTCLDIRLTEGRDYILPNSTRRTRHVADGIFMRAGIDVNDKYTVSDMQTAIQMVQAGLGLTLIPQSSRKYFEQRSPCYYDIDPLYIPVWQPGVCYSSDIPLSRPAQEFIRICLEILPEFYAKQNG